ncbi:hypothetical protein [Kitasatospora sp. NPDC057541]|uniref:hypothetical protein n=1 Tax=unclassified Kitasatospora TaxID=2633591 RepID=UPI0036BCF6B4
MMSSASNSATPPHGRRPAHGTASAAVAAAVVQAEGRLPVGPGGFFGGFGGPDLLDFDGFEPPVGPVAPVGPWSVRSVPAGRGRAALEVYEHGELVDVVVAARLGRGLLRGARAWTAAGTGAGARTGGRRRTRHGLAWGRLPSGAAAPAVGFTGGRLLRLPGRPAPVVVAGEVVTVAGEFWLAWAEGVFDGVLVEPAGGAGSERSPLTRVRAVRAVRDARATRDARALVTEPEDVR